MKLEDILGAFFVGTVSGLVSAYLVFYGDNPTLYSFFSVIGMAFLALGLAIRFLCENSSDKRVGKILLCIGLLIGILQFIFNLWS